LNQKVICNRVSICEDRDDCEHGVPHEIETWKSYKTDEPMNCTCEDSCNEFKNVRCVPFCIDFGIEGLFIL